MIYSLQSNAFSDVYMMFKKSRAFMTAKGTQNLQLVDYIKVKKILIYQFVVPLFNEQFASDCFFLIYRSYNSRLEFRLIPFAWPPAAYRTEKHSSVTESQVITIITPHSRHQSGIPSRWRPHIARASAKRGLSSIRLRICQINCFCFWNPILDFGHRTFYLIPVPGYVCTYIHVTTSQLNVTSRTKPRFQ